MRTSAKSNSRKFGVASYSSTRLQPLDNRLCCTPLGSNHPDLVAVVAPMCIKGLRLVTMQLPVKFSPIGLGTNRRFAYSGFHEVHNKIRSEGAHILFATSSSSYTQRVAPI